MSLFQLNWLKRFIRRHMKPIPVHTASTWNNRFSLLYMLAAWNAFGIVCYCIYQGKADWATYHGLPKEEGTPAQQWTKTLGIKDATVYRVSGFQVTKYEIHNDESKNNEEEVASLTS